MPLPPSCQVADQLVGVRYVYEENIQWPRRGRYEDRPN